MIDEEELHPNKQEPESYSPHLTLLAPIALGILPCLCFGLLLVINPDYMSQLLYGPPVGAFIPGMPIPMGWPFIFVTILLVAIAMGANLLLVRWAIKNELQLKVVLSIAAFMVVSLGVQSVACWIVVMGPSFIQLWKAFF